MSDQPEVVTNEACDNLYPLTFHRRGFLGALGGVAVLCAVSEVEAQQQERPPGPISEWLHIDEDGGITVYTGKVEIGQNIRTTLAQVVAEELRTDPDRITMVMGDTDLCPYDAGTFGSQTTPRMVPVLRRAACSAREVLSKLAAERWQVPVGEVKLADGKVVHPASGRDAEFAALTKGQKLVETVSDLPATPPEQWQHAGRSRRKVDGAAIVTGRHVYPGDFTLPGLWHGKVLRPPAMGAKLTNVDTSAAEAMDGVKVVKDGDLIGVAATDEHLAAKAIDAIKATWSEGSGPTNKELFDILRPHPFKPMSQGQDAVVRSQTYTVQYIAHVPLEPRAAVAQWTDDGRLLVWTGTQRPFGVHRELVQTFGLRNEQVRVQMPDMGSGYGGKHTGETAIEAARLARGAGRPVKVLWTREEEFAWAYFRPAGLMDISGALDASGKLTTWRHDMYNAGGAGLNTPYDVPDKQQENHRSDSPLRQGSYRGLAGPANFFGRESMMDELAHDAKLDPLEFRLRNSGGNPRLQGVLRAAADKFGWRNKPPANHGYGIACGYEKLGWVASCAEVAVDPETRALTVVRMVTAFDCGKVINPDTVLNQMEGMQSMGLGGALFEQILFGSGEIKSRWLSRYRVPRFSDQITTEYVLMDPADQPSVGAGETPQMAIAPAIANAIYRACGVRLRGLPLAPDGIVDGSTA